ncbi:hypothetical protein ACTID9_05900 [Brevibacillus fluminis]|uniref:hypothetical protein n=1 Tax=Brevibacillus fluminis TaxID=511487 RepID=UPI003F8AA786
MARSRPPLANIGDEVGSRKQSDDLFLIVFEEAIRHDYVEKNADSSMSEGHNRLR